MGAVSVYCPDDKKQGRTFKLSSQNSKDPFFTFRLEPSGGGSSTYNNKSEKPLRGIVTDLALEKSESISLASSLGSDMFLYVGGASPWIVQISGYAFSLCNDEATTKSGFDSILEWYNNENVSHTGGYCKLTIGSQVFKGYLTNCQIASVSKETLNLFRFRFKFIAVKLQYS